MNTVSASASSLESHLPAPASRPGQARVGKVQAQSGSTELSAQELAEVARLEQVDRQVRQHEMAHMTAGAGLTSGARYSYRRGPDGRSFAVSGEVGISMAKGQTPQDTLARARQIEAAALAPADPSAQDHAVAASAARMALQAQAELARQQADAARAAIQDKQRPGDSDAAARAYRDMDLLLHRAHGSFSAQA